MKTLQKIDFDKERDFSDSISIVFDFLRSEFVPLIKSLAVFALIPSVIYGIIKSLYVKGTIFDSIKTIIAGESDHSSTELSVWYPILMVFAIITSILITIVTLEYMHQYYQKGKGNFSNNDIWQGIKTKIGTILGASTLYLILIIIGLILLIVPGIWFTVVALLIAPAIIFENASIWQSIKRARFLISSNWWSTFGIILIASILQSILSGLFSIPAFIYGMIKALHATGDALQELANDNFILIITAISAVAEAWLSIITTLAVGFIFFSLREKKENRTILNEISTITDEKQI